MESSGKKIISAYALLLFGILLLFSVYAKPEYKKMPAKKSKIAEKYQKTGKTAEEGSLIVWYTGKENRSFFQMCADDFKKETGIAVVLEERPSLNYFSEIYEAVKTDMSAPDVYLLEADEMEQAYRCQLLEKNSCTKESIQGLSEQAVKAVTKGENLYAYPLYFNTAVFAYRSDYFELTPKTVQEMIDYSIEHDPGQGVEKLLEWNLADGFYNFMFFGNAVSFEMEDTGTLLWNYEKDVYEAHKDFFGNLTAAIELDEKTISSQTITEDFKNGKTVAVFCDSDDMVNLKGENVEFAELPQLNEELSMLPIAKTMALCVNSMSEKISSAMAFAEYVTAEKIDRLTELTGHVAVRADALSSEEEKIAYLQYEKAVLEPDALNTTDFWVKFQNEVLQIWNE